MEKSNEFDVIKLSAMDRREKMLYVYAGKHLDILRKDKDVDVRNAAKKKWNEGVCQNLNNKLRAMGLYGDGIKD